MFDDSPTLSKYTGGRRKVIGVHLGHVPYVEPETDEDRKPLKLAVVLAVLAHLVFFALTLPEGADRPLRAGQQKPVFAVKPVRFQPPPPRAEQQVPQKQEKRRVIPIPDPTPEEPEPIRIAQVDVPDIDVVSDRDVIFGIPEGPPADGRVTGAIRVTGDVQPPEKIYGPTPRYTEEGRQSRTQGVVILEAIVDTEGNVDSVKVLKGLPNGLSESAVETARTWRYRPALLRGRPVAVLLNLTIRFSLQ